MEELQSLGFVTSGPWEPICDPDRILVGYINPGNVFRTNVPGEKFKAWVREFRSSCDVGVITGGRK